MREGKARYVTAVSQTDIAEGWREHRQSGGCIIDVQSNQVIGTGLSMPHSPRYYQGKLWLHNSGTGEFGQIDLETGEFIPVAFCPGYLRGLAFSGDFAIAGLSKPRENKTFAGLRINERLDKEKVQARCGLAVIDLKSGDVVHSLNIDGIVEELYDVVTLPKIRKTMAIGFRSDEIRRVISIGE